MLLPGVTVVLKLTSDDSCVQSSACSTALCAMTLTGLQIPYFAICLSPGHRFSLKLNGASCKQVHTQLLCEFSMQDSSTYRVQTHTNHRQRQKKKKTITRGTNPLIRT